MVDPQPYLEKVTGFVTRRSETNGLALLLIQHPYAGVQIPAGTVEAIETPEQAVLREVMEETGLEDHTIVQKIGWRDELPPGATHVVFNPTKVYARPNTESFDWARLPRGAAVHLERRSKDFAQITYAEGDHYPDPQFTTFQITGWVPVTTLASANRRHFFHLSSGAETPAQWDHFADNHTFRVFWVSFLDLPEIVHPQHAWLHYVLSDLRYHFE